MSMAVGIPDDYRISWRERAVGGRVKRNIRSLRLAGHDDREEHKRGCGERYASEPAYLGVQSEPWQGRV